MPCGKRPLVKKWDRPRQMKLIKPSRYQTNEASVKKHWKNVIKELELSYKDDKFWDTSTDIVRDLVSPVIFERLREIFNLPADESVYQPRSDSDSIVSSEDAAKFQRLKSLSLNQLESKLSSEYSMEEMEEYDEEEQSELSTWSETEVDNMSTTALRKDRSKAVTGTSRSVILNRTKSSSNSRGTRIFSVTASKMKIDDLSRSKSNIRKLSRLHALIEEEATSMDDVEVQVGTLLFDNKKNFKTNPHYNMLYCNESETDMIKWNSKYKQKVFEISASDEYSKKAEILTKQIAKDFYDWWVDLGSVEFKSEIKRPEDIEDLFQLWFDEHASRGLVLHSKILPCVLKSIADFVQKPKLACSEVLKRQIACDIYAETTPAHTRAFDTSLPNKLKHLPPRNNTSVLWKSAEIPEDLRTMSYVWEDIMHLTSTKSFQTWLKGRPHLPMPIYLRDSPKERGKALLFDIPSDFYLSQSRSHSGELNLPVSKISFELNDVLSKLLNQ